MSESIAATATRSAISLIRSNPDPLLADPLSETADVIAVPRRLEQQTAQFIQYLDDHATLSNAEPDSVASGALYGAVVVLDIDVSRESIAMLANVATQTTDRHFTTIQNGLLEKARAQGTFNIDSPYLHPEAHLFRLSIEKSGSNMSNLLDAETVARIDDIDSLI